LALVVLEQLKRVSTRMLAANNRCCFTNEDEIFDSYFDKSQEGIVQN